MAKANGKLRATWLGKLLREHREATGRKLAEAAEYLGRSASMLSRMENGELPIPEYDVVTLLDLYGLTDRSWRESLLRLHASSGVTAWWDLYSHDVAEPVIDLAWLESIATGIDAYCATLVDGLLQTAGYALAVARSQVDEFRIPDQRWAELVTMRQAVLARAEPPAFRAVIDEAVLLRPVGGAGIMAAQLRHLLHLTERGTVELRVLPLATGAHASPDGAFSILRLPPPLTEVATAACPLGQLYLEPPRTTPLVATYDRLWEAALAPGPSAERLAARADDLDREQP